MDSTTTATTAAISIGILFPDSAIGSREALRRLLGLLGGTVGAGAVNESFLGFINFRPLEQSAAAPQLAPLLRGINWRSVFADLCRLGLRQINNANPCRHCGGRERYHVGGRVQGVACCKCGNIVPLKQREGMPC